MDGLLDSVEPWIQRYNDGDWTDLCCAREYALQTLEKYKILATAEILRKRSSTAIALQFPDALLSDSFIVCKALEAALEAALENDENGRKAFVFILGDTSYGECCVDEVAAKHLNADMLVHYGNACLSPTKTLPVVYVFPNRHSHAQPISRHRLTSICTKVQDLTGNVETVVLLYDVENYEIMLGRNGLLTDAVESLAEGSRIPSVVVAKPRCDVSDVVLPRGDDVANSKDASCLAAVGSRTGCACMKHDGIEENETLRSAHPRTRSPDSKSTMVIEIGPLKYEVLVEQSENCISPLPEAIDNGTVFLWCSLSGDEELSEQLRNAALTVGGPGGGSIYVWRCMDEQGITNEASANLEKIDMSKFLVKRYSLLQKARDAERIGIVAGTLGISGNLSIIDRCKRAIESSGKRWYLLLVGKPTVPKLGNFHEIDVFVLVACPQSTLVDSKEYLRPIVSPLELEVALGLRDFFGRQYHLDFADLLRESEASFVDSKSALGIEEETSERMSAEISLTESSLAKRCTWDVAVGGHDGAANFLHRRLWQGLDPSCDSDGRDVNDLPAQVMTGRKGTASRYVGEG